MVSGLKLLAKIAEMNSKAPRYIVSYIGYQHASIGDDDACDGWNGWYTHRICRDRPEAIKFANKVRKDRFCMCIAVH
jgi:hypothetical protein